MAREFCRTLLLLSFLLLLLLPTSAEKLGGFTDADLGSPVVQEAAQFAVTHGQSAMAQQDVATVEVTEAQSQVVNGVKYLLAIRATAKTFNCQLLTATVFRDLQGVYSLIDKTVRPCLGSSFRGRRTGSTTETPANKNKVHPQRRA